MYEPQEKEEKKRKYVTTHAPHGCSQASRHEVICMDRGKIFHSVCTWSGPHSESIKADHFSESSRSSQ
jgi:hypothetical protein